MFLRFRPGRDVDAVRFAHSIGRPISTAELQCILLAGDPFAAGDVVETDAVEIAHIPAAAE
jgi:hypothetical protein